MTTKTKSIGWVWLQDNGVYHHPFVPKKETIEAVYGKLKGKAVEVIAKPQPMSDAEVELLFNTSKHYKLSHLFIEGYRACEKHLGIGVIK